MEHGSRLEMPPGDHTYTPADLQRLSLPHEPQVFFSSEGAALPAAGCPFRLKWQEVVSDTWLPRASTSTLSNHYWALPTSPVTDGSGFQVNNFSPATTSEGFTQSARTLATDCPTFANLNQGTAVLSPLLLQALSTPISVPKNLFAQQGTGNARTPAAESFTSLPVPQDGYEITTVSQLVDNIIAVLRDSENSTSGPAELLPSPRSADSPGFVSLHESNALTSPRHDESPPARTPRQTSTSPLLQSMDEQASEATPPSEISTTGTPPPSTEKKGAVSAPILCCQHCEKKFTLKSSLARHAKNHAAKAHECGICRKRFTRTDIMKRHFIGCSQKLSFFQMSGGEKEQGQNGK